MITIGFSKSDTIMSWLIRVATGSKASHCFLVHEVIGVECAIEAIATGVSAVPMADFVMDNEIVEIVSVEAPFESGLKFAAMNLGCPYDFLGLFGFLWVLIGRKLGRSWSNPFRGSGRLFCSEAVVRVLARCGVPGASLLDPDSCSPGDVLSFLKRSSE